ncbi:RNA-directed DNA polymerase, eukaryota [Tanacetum coccineum]
MGYHKQNSLQSKADQAARISKSVFVSNFPECCTAKDLWNVCNNYGTVVDVFIQTKKSKVGKRFAFVRFIKVFNLDRLIENLNTIWIGRFHLFANPVHFERPKKPNPPNHNNVAAAPSYSMGVNHAKVKVQNGSYVNVVNGFSPAVAPGPSISSASALVLDDSCVVERDLTNHAMGKVKDVNSIPNLRTLLTEEGFSVVNLVYLGGMWVMFEFDKVETKENMMQHTGVKSWFHVIQNATHDFVSDERIVWVDIEGIPLNVWSRETFTRIVHSSFCEEDSSNDSVSDVEEVSETIFGDNSSNPINNNDEIEKQQSEDPFMIYDLLKKQTGGDAREMKSSLSHPPGFTPDVSEIRKENGHIVKEFPAVVNAKLMNNSQEVYKEASSENVDLNVVKNGSSILGVLEDMIRVGKAMRYSMDGCVKDLEHIIRTQEAGDVPRRISYPLIFKAVGNSGGILCVWEANVFKKDYATISDNFVAIYGTWLPSNSKILFVDVYAPQHASCKRILWDFVSTLIGRWSGEAIILGDFNEVRSIDKRCGSCFNPSSARAFDHFISSSGLVDVKLEGYAFTWSHPSGSKMSKLDRFLVSEGIFSIFPSITAICLDRHLSDHRPIILREDLKVIIQCWVKDKRMHISGNKNSIKNELSDIDKLLDRGDVSDTNLLRRLELHRKLHDINQMEAKDSLQKSKAFFNHFEARFRKPIAHRLMLNFPFNKRLSVVQADELERSVSREEIRLAVWNCGENKSPGPNRFSFEFFRKYWNLVGPDFCEADEHFFETGLFPKGCNSSFVALIPKVTDAKFVNDFPPISLIGSVYKVVTKVLANRLALVILDLISDTQSAFVANRQILDGPFILNEILHWCKRKKKQAMFFKVDFAKAYDSVRWDYLLDVLEAFGFGQTWCNWIRGTFSSTKASVLVNGSPSNEFSFHCGLKQGDPLSPYLFILIMESLHMSFTRAVDEGVFKGVHLQGSTSISHLFYADDAMFIGEWSDANLKGIVNILQCFFLASGLKINIHKSQVLGVGVPSSIVMQAASSIGCGVMHKQFRYLGVMIKTLSIGGILTLLKAVLGASPLYNMSIFKVPKGILKSMEVVRSNFFNGIESPAKKITWAAWNKILASKKNGGLGVSSLHALNRALLLKWVWRFISQDGSLWFRVIKALYGTSIVSHPVNLSSNWCSIVRELHLLANKGFDFLSHCKIRIGDGNGTRFWFDKWLGDKPLQDLFPRLFALELDKEALVANKVKDMVTHSFRQPVRDGSEHQQLVDLNSLMDSVSLSQSHDRWSCDLSGDGDFRVKEVRNFLDNLFLPSHVEPTRWVKYIPIKINVFAWRARRDYLPTRANLARRGIPLDSPTCSLCLSSEEDIHHVLFRCDLAQIIFRRICRWWELNWQDLMSFSDWNF